MPKEKRFGGEWKRDSADCVAATICRPTASRFSNRSRNPVGANAIGFGNAFQYHRSANRSAGIANRAGAGSHALSRLTPSPARSEIPSAATNQAWTGERIRANPGERETSACKPAAGPKAYQNATSVSAAATCHSLR